MPDAVTVQIAMPEMGESVTEGIVLEFHVAEGDFVNEGDTVVEVSTDKVDAEVPAPTSGTIHTRRGGRDAVVGGGRALLERETGGASDGDGSGASTAGPVAEDDSPTHPSGSSPSAPPTGETAATGAGPN